ncbi:MAG: hypothetical protein Q4A78_04755 [Peptostreptococcaceae bacterium]|nr:hypothetical protein [Peptostreptococcaceae bacterium]
MSVDSNSLSFVLLSILWIHSLGKISAYLRLNYERVTVVMVLSVVCIGHFYHYRDFRRINENPANGERYKVKEAFFDYTFHEDQSAEAEHRLLFEENKKHNEKNTFSYVFYERGGVRSLEVRLNGSLIEPSRSKTPNTYELQTAGNQHRLTLYLPDSASKTMDLQINYVAMNALLKKEGLPVYYNTFFPKRTDFSFNTNVRGRITFHFPEASLLRSGAHAEGFWVQRKDLDKTSVAVDFKNKLPYEEVRLFRRHGIWVCQYDPTAYDKAYIKDFSLITRLDFSPAPFQGGIGASGQGSHRNAYSVSELQRKNQENNRQFSDIKFILGVLETPLNHAIGMLLLLSSPFLLFYYHNEKKKERNERERAFSDCYLQQREKQDEEER